jgi:RHS repeat-associated protein
VTSTKTSRADASPPVFGLPLATIRSPLLSNALGSLGGVTQNAGGQFTDQLYYPWGQFWTYQVLKYGPQFAGTERVEPYASDTYPTPNRIYSGNYGRWLSPDPLGGDVSNPQSLNRYAYVMNNPTSFVDPLGLFRCWNSGTGTYCGAETGVTGLDSGGWGGEGDRAADPLLVYAPTITHNGAGTGTQVDDTGAPIDAPLGTPCAANGQAIDNYLASKKSPMAGMGEDFYVEGFKNNVDPRLIVAISGAETTFANFITRGQYNAWNWLWNGRNSYFTSWASGIRSVTKGIGGKNYLADPAGSCSSTTTLYIGHYCNGPDCKNGLANLNGSLVEQGGDPTSLSFPCDRSIP